MVRRILLIAALVAGWTWQRDNRLRGDEPPVLDSKIGDRNVKMTLTGSAVRTKSIFKVYAIDSYVEQGSKIRTAQDMIAADQPKQFHLTMLRKVSGPDMAENFLVMLRANHPEPEFQEEARAVATLLRGQTAHKGDEIWFTHVPKVGFQCQGPAGKVHLIRNVEFSKAVWENYFGKHNVGENVKQALLSRLPKE
jgi:hypothetical protein